MDRPRRSRTLAEPDVAPRTLPDSRSAEGSVALRAEGSVVLPAEGSVLLLSEGSVALVKEDSIALRAYRRFEERGRQHGHDLDDWLEAEREVIGMASE